MGRSSTNTALEFLAMLDSSSNVKPRLKLILNSLLVFPMLMLVSLPMLMPLLLPPLPPSLMPFPNPLSRPLRLPALKSKPNIALMSQSSKIVTPVETCHVVTKVDCTPAVHSIPKVTCEAGTTEVVHHVPAAVGYHHLG